jgi:AraC-like DNA-binding protein
MLWYPSSDCEAEATFLRSLIDRVSLQRLAVRIDLSQNLAELISWLADSLPVLRVSVMQLNTAREDVDWLQSTRSTSAEHWILNLLSEGLSPALRDLIFPFIIAGRHRVSVARFAGLHRTAVRTLEERCQRSAVPSPNVLLGWSVCLHAAWRLQVDHLTIKQVAEETGFSAAADLSNYVMRHISMRPRELKRPRSTHGLGKRFLEAVVRRTA